MTPAARMEAVLALAASVEAGGGPADRIASNYFRARRYIGSSDRRAISLQLWGLLRRRARLDWWLSGKGAPTDARRRLIADLVFDSHLTLAEIDALFTGREHAAEKLSGDERALIQKLTGVAFVHRRMPLWVKCEFPEFLARQLEAAFGPELEREMAALAEPAPVDLRVNTLKATVADARAALAADGLAAEPMRLSPVGLRLPARTALGAQDSFRAGLVEVQDEGSQIAALLVGARPGEAVVDYCAGAGGKTLALAAAMRNKGRLAALDVDKKRSERAAGRLRRAGVFNAARHVLTGETDSWIKRRLGSFDRVLVDAPCSGSGTWRRNPDARWRLAPADLDRLVERQAAILASAARLAKKGGRLVYATCSLLPAENDEQVTRFIAAHPEFAIQPMREVWAESLAADCPAQGDFLRLTPARHGTDGFFVAVLARRG